MSSVRLDAALHASTSFFSLNFVNFLWWIIYVEILCIIQYGVRYFTHACSNFANNMKCTSSKYIIDHPNIFYSFYRHCIRVWNVVKCQLNFCLYLFTHSLVVYQLPQQNMHPHNTKYIINWCQKHFIYICYIHHRARTTTLHSCSAWTKQLIHYVLLLLKFANEQLNGN